MTKKVVESTLLICWEAEQIESRLPAVVPVCQGRKTTWLRAWLPENVHISQWACVSKRVLCQLSRMMCYSLSWKCSYLCLSSFFNLEAWNKSFKLISDIVHTLIFFKEQNSVWEPNKRRPTWFLPTHKRTKKTCSKRNTKPPSPASQHFIKDIFDVIQNNVYLSYVYPSCVYEFSTYAACIGVRGLHLCGRVSAELSKYKNWKHGSQGMVYEEIATAHYSQ